MNDAPTIKICFLAFWLKDDIYYEQPVVAYRYQAIFEWGGYKSNKESLNLYYSTSSTMNDLYEKQLRIPLLRTREIDVNLDGKIDRIELNVQVPLEIGETIHSFTGCVYTDIQFNGKSKYYFDAAAYLQYGSPLPMTSLLVDGTYMIHQTWPLTAKGGYGILNFVTDFSVGCRYHVPYESDPLFPQLNGLTSADEVSLEYVMTKYAARNGR